MPRHNDISRSITSYVTCYIIAFRALAEYENTPSLTRHRAAQLWLRVASTYAHKVTEDWGW